ncbi:hypothetical protein [Pedobacter psychrodurus]|uniref:hypothetical protein n=1 Tax=Pedobacter psychrodurus TaxID=2530456 RepID=UPI00292F941F|nr:hypothetical protein [Pedobacter psychrodurus]
MKKLFPFFYLVLILIGCGKVPQGDLSGDEQMIGRLFLSEPLINQLADSPLAKKKVTIRYADAADKENYLFSTTTDAEGYFVFSNLKKDILYTVVYQETIDSILYESRDNSSIPTNKLVVTAEMAKNKQNGLIVTVGDASMSPLKDAEICIFTNPLSPGYVAGKCEGSSYTLKTDAKGRAKLFNITSGDYYFVASKLVNQQTLTGKANTSISNTVKEVPITLEAPNGIHFLTTDANNEIIPAVSICVFTSKILFDRDVCEGSNFQLNSGTEGEATKYSIAQGTYYVLGMKVLGKDTLIARQSLTVGKGIAQSVLKLEKK